MSIKSIQTRLLIILVPLIFVVLGVLSGISYYLSNLALTQSVSETAMAVGTDYSKRLKSDMELAVSQLADLASVQRVRTGSDRALIIEAMTETVKRLGTLDSISFLAPDGSGFRSDASNTNLADREYFKKALATGKAAFSNPLISKGTGKTAVALAVPVTNDGKMTGVLAASVNLDRLTGLIKDVKFLDTGYGFVVDASGLVIAHPKHPELTGKLNLTKKQIDPELKLPEAELDDRMIALFKAGAESGKQMQGEYTFGGVAQMAVVTPVDLPGGQRWVMIVTAPVSEANHKTTTLARTMLIVSGVFLILAVVFIVVMARWFAKPIIVIRDECLLLAQGDLREHAAEIMADDEIGQLAKGFRQMRTSLRQLVGAVNSQSTQLAAASEEMTASAEQSAQAANLVSASIVGVAQGAEEQLAAASDTSMVVAEMSVSFQQVAASAHEVAAQSAQAAVKATDGGKAVDKAVDQMLAIEKTAQVTAATVTKLNDQSKEIGQIVDTIAGIAGQTNLLALNAAIEAARAGEQGRGFAVVAEEVRKLAEQSQQAAKQIEALIGQIQEDTHKAVEAMTDGAREVQLGTEVVNTAGQSFREIATLVTQMSDQVKDMSGAIEQMANGNQQIVGSVQRIDAMSKKTAGEAQTVSAATEEQSASMEEIASSSQALARLAEELQQSIRRFKL
ncbi:MAG: methyl-accepting chemotaxis protein [Negativicutes bacterium]|nr:methyl-accepting chemotaxis protein [Negativicutes bacterium]